MQIVIEKIYKTKEQTNQQTSKQTNDHNNHKINTFFFFGITTDVWLPQRF